MIRIRMARPPLLLGLIFTVFFNRALSAPEITTIPDTQTLPIGSAASLECRINNLDGRTVTWRKVDHDTIISEGINILAKDKVKYSVLSVISDVTFDLQILYLNALDQGFYECAVKGTDQAIVYHLDVLDVDNYPVSHTPSQPLNQTNCCKRNNVSSNCLVACVPDPIDLDTFDALGLCGTMDDLTGLSRCFADGSNHDSCCLAQGIDPLYLPFCHDEVDSNQLTQQHLVKCFDNTVIRKIFECFASGSELLPGPPIQVTAIAVYDGRRVSSIIVKWRPPNKNPDKVIGYTIMFRKEGDDHFMSYPLPASARQHRLNERIEGDTTYEIHMIAVGQHGASLGSLVVKEYVPSESTHSQQNNDINECCKDRGVDDTCRQRLCRSKTWSHFSSSQVLECAPQMDDIFQCLSGVQNNTGCCSAYGVNTECLPLCSGHPPNFRSDLLPCVFDMSIIEACVQKNYGKSPLPPTKLTLDDVGSDYAVLSFSKSKTTNIVQYLVHVSEGSEGKNFEQKQTLGPAQNVIRLNGLDPNSYYNVRVVTETDQADSLPSETVSFLTYPASEGQPTIPPVINRPHDLKECCKNKNMPELCWQGCEYVPNMTAYYSDKLAVCRDHIGSVLTCAADGRNHTSCCQGKEMPSNCLGLCTMSQVGQLDPSFYPCVSTTYIAILCFIEGIEDLPRHPDLVIESKTSSTIKVTWKQPETSGAIDSYILLYGVAGTNKTERNVVTTNDTIYILQDLRSGTEYMISAQSVNENGTSIESPVRTVFTDAVFTPPTVNTTVPEDRALWLNITHCCENSGIADECLDMCSNMPATTVIESNKCESDHHKMLACFTNGQDHSVCCRSANLPEECVPLCAGHPADLDAFSVSCMSYGHRDTILGCVLEKQDLVPTVPIDLTVQARGRGAVSVAWSRPQLSCRSDCKFDIHYWLRDSPAEVETLEDQTSPVNVDLKTDRFYVFTVVARNIHGAGAPAPWVTVFVRNLDRDVEVLLDSNVPYVEINQAAVLVCSTSGFSDDDPPALQWILNKRVLEGETRRNLIINNVNPMEHEGLYTCQATDSFVRTDASLYLPVMYKPILDELREDSGPVSGTSRISCWFKGYPNSASDRWYLNNAPIENLDSSKYKLTNDIRYHTGITTYKIRIDDMTPEDYGLYSIEVSNKFGKTSCTANLRNPDTAPTVEPPAQKEADPMQCCVNNGVSGLCQDLCSFDTDLASALSNPQYIPCTGDFEVLIKCGADGRDHTKCCKNNGVTPYCFPFCRGNAPGSVLNDTLQMLTCVSDIDKIFSCIETGHTRNPYPPTDVNVSQGPDSRSAIVTWQPPQFNQDLVQHYYIHYYHDNSQEQWHSVSDKVTSYMIRDLVPNKVYTIYVVAGNRYGKSLKSNLAKYPDYEGLSPANVAANIVPESGGVIRMTWEATGADSFRVYYKKKTDSSYTITTTRNTYYLLKNLASSTTYDAYVIAIMASGKQSPASEVISFTTSLNPTTGAQGGDDDDDTAIIIGVVVAIIAVLAIVLLVVFFLFRARVKTARPADAVTFENPGYGKSGTVNIQGLGDDNFGYGRLQEDSVGQNQYDNPTSGSTMESSSDPHTYDNPMTQEQQPQQNMTGGVGGSPATLDLSSAQLTYS